MNMSKDLNPAEFAELLKQVCSIASRELGRDHDYIWGTVGQPLIDCNDVLESRLFRSAIEKRYNIVFNPFTEDITESLLDVAFYVCHYDFFQQGEQTPSVLMEKMMEIREKMRPVLESIWPKEVVSDYYIYSPDSLYHMKRRLGLDPSLYWDMVPNDFALCFDKECPLRNRCVRWQAGELLPDEIYTAMCVMPCSRIGESCWMYACKDDAVSYKDFFKQYTDKPGLL